MTTLYVDDIIIAGNKELVEETLEQLRKVFMSKFKEILKIISGVKSLERKLDFGLVKKDC
jgi:hypothetical protein